ncbi:MAG: hypothetical protein ACRDMX_14360 [Solirubrobacteraceae bacterium]
MSGAAAISAALATAFGSAGPDSYDSFAFRGNNSGNIFQMTAGHCGGSSIWTNLSTHYEMGGISSVYFSNGGYDLETFGCDCNEPVWYEGPGIGTGQGSTQNVVGIWYCGDGSAVSTDGATTGQVTGNTVEATNQCVEFGDGKTTCHLNYAVNPSGQAICQPGDSGGPVYQRIGNNNVYATGVIVGEYVGDDCYYEDINDVLNLVNGSIMTG